MASVINLASQRINTDVAGHTYIPERAGDTPGSPVGLVPSEVASAAHSGAFDGSLGFLSGGIHPEALLDKLLPVNNSEVVPTDSKPGRTGGLVPRGTGTLAPGPAGAVAAARSTLAKVRARLQI